MPARLRPFLLLKLAITAGAGCAMLLCAVTLYLAPALPSVEQLLDVRLQTPLRVFSADGVLIGEFGEQRRTPIAYEQIPEPLIQAMLAAEDDNFFNHRGIDFLGLLRAGWEIVTSRQIRSGGSTITMQVARNFFLSRKQTFIRKFNEIILAVSIENELSKPEILELYANKIYLGKRAYGVQAAAQIYYGADVGALNVAQWAMIAGLPKAPSAANPINNPERARARRDWILGRMRRLEFLTEAEWQAAVAEPLSARLQGSMAIQDALYAAEMARIQLVEKYGERVYEDGYEVVTTIDTGLQRGARRAVQDGVLAYDARHGWRGAEQNEEHDWATLVGDESAALEALESVSDVADLVPALVVAVDERAVDLLIKERGAHRLEWEDGLAEARPFRTPSWRGEPPENAGFLAPGDLIRVREREGRWVLAQVPAVQAALVAMDPNSGAIRALQGGFDFLASRFNRITDAARQPGSSLKPFLYTAALAGGFTPATTVSDAPIVFDDATLEDVWRPENYSGKFYGPTRLREALYRSRNLISIRVLRELGLGYTRNFMIEHFGFADEELATDLTLALGSQALPPLQIAAGFTVFANGGYRVQPHLIDEIRDRQGEVLFKALPPQVCYLCEQQTEPDALVAPPGEDGEAEYSYPRAARVLDARVHFMMDSMLRDVVDKGTGRRAKKLGRADLAGKTGTTNGPRDAWFAGYNRHLVATAWLGFDDNSLLGGESGATAALPIWVDFMRGALAGVPEQSFTEPFGLIRARIDPKTGARAQPGATGAIFEYFLRENGPAAAAPAAQSTPADDDGDTVDEIF
ncbi:MAG: PBP1A family penicillin-binding protein [Cellvibrionales bacterium]|nr:PBP1A family penicillin-binding protein [Cellvibrionales bacterium]